MAGSGCNQPVTHGQHDEHGIRWSVTAKPIFMLICRTNWRITSASWCAQAPTQGRRVWVVSVRPSGRTNRSWVAIRSAFRKRAWWINAGKRKIDQPARRA